MLKDIERRIRSLEARLNQSVQVGEVVSVDAAKATVRVRLATPSNEQGLVTHDLPVLVRKTHVDKDYTMPDVGEQVLCVFLPMGLETGFVLGSFYSEQDAVPVTSADKWRVQFENGTSFEYDRAAEMLSVNVTGSQNQDTTGDKTESVGGTLNITVTGEATVSAEKISLVGGGGAVDGVITGKCMCAVFGMPHPDKSSTVLASK